MHWESPLQISSTCTGPYGYGWIRQLTVKQVVVYLVNIKFNKLGCDTYWWTFQFGKQSDIECTLLHMMLHNTCDISSVGVHEIW